MSPGHLWLLVIACTAVGLAGLTLITYTGAVRAAAGATSVGRRPTALTGIVGAALAALLLAATLLGDARILRSDVGVVPVLGIVFLTVLLAALAASYVPIVARALDDSAALTALQSARVVGGAFLIALLLGHASPVFALPAGLGDLAVGIAAPFIARRIARRPTRRAGIITYHLLGMGDLVIAVTLGTLMSPRLGLFGGQPTEALTELPLALIPTVVVPIWLVLHLMALRSLRRMPRDR